MISDFKPLGSSPEVFVKRAWKIPRFWKVSMLRSEKNRPKLGLLSVFLGRGVIPYGEGGGQVHKPSLDLSEYQVVRQGDLVLNNQQAWRGSVGVSKFDGIISPAYIVFALADYLNADFANYLFQSRIMVNQFVTSSKGVGDIQRDIYYPWLKNVRVPIPSFEEQAAIVWYLDYVDRRVRRYVRAKQKLIELLEEQKQAIIHRAVTRGLDPDVRLKSSGVEWLGDVPEHWEVKRLRYLIEGKLTYGANAAAEHANPDWPRYLRITDFGLDGTLRRDTFCSLPLEVAKDYLVEPGDILLARSGATVGKAFLVTSDAGKACHAGYLIRARSRRSLIEPKYLFALTQSTYFMWWKDTTLIIATIQNISAEKYSNLFVPFPPLAEQSQILYYLDTATVLIDTAIDSTRRGIKLLREYYTRLISDVVTGKLDVRKAAAKLSNERNESESLDEADIFIDSDEEIPHDLDTNPEEEA